MHLNVKAYWMVTQMTNEVEYYKYMVKCYYKNVHRSKLYVLFRTYGSLLIRRYRCVHLPRAIVLVKDKEGLQFLSDLLSYDNVMHEVIELPESICRCYGNEFKYLGELARSLFYTLALLPELFLQNVANPEIGIFKVSTAVINSFLNIRRNYTLSVIDRMLHDGWIYSYEKRNCSGYVIYRLKIPLHLLKGKNLNIRQCILDNRC